MIAQKENTDKTLNRCLVALGSNLPGESGESATTVERAIGSLSKGGLGRLKVSRLYSTPAFPAGSGPDFVNAAVACETQLSAPEVMDVLHGIEARMGRTRHVRWQARILDLDLVDFAGVVLPDLDTYQKWFNLTLKEQMAYAPDQLILPHPRVQDRSFVLIPLRDVAPDWRHPVSRRHIDELIGVFSQKELAQIRPVKNG